MRVEIKYNKDFRKCREERKCREDEKMRRGGKMWSERKR
jgi:hypothetical protein